LPFSFSNRRLGTDTIDLEFFVVDWVPDFFNRGKGASTMGFSNL